MAKTGTHSLAEMFVRPVRARHLAEAPVVIDRIFARQDGQLSDRAMADWLRARDHRLLLDIDSSTLNFELLDPLLAEFPDARFVLTLRDCYSWLESFLNHATRFDGRTHPRWLRLRKLRFKPNTFDYSPAEDWLRREGFYPLDCYLTRWAEHQLHVLTRVPTDRLFVVRTRDLGPRALEVAAFAAIPATAVRPDRAFAYRNPAKQPLVRRIDRDTLEAVVDARCRPLMQRYFPEIRSLDDAPL